MSRGTASVLQGFDQYTETETANAKVADNPTQHLYSFTPKFQDASKNNPMCGICLPEWLTILQQRGRDIEWNTYWPRLLAITMLSIVNSILAIPERLLYGKKIQQTEVHQRPVFILGHPRTGTTLLHSLLALDEEEFSICSTFCAGFPSCFLWFESIGKSLFADVMDKTRPMDNVELHFDLPQEDELATNVLCAGNSAYMPLFFMKQERDFRPFYAFLDHDVEAKSPDSDEAMFPPEAMAKARKTWTDSFLYLLKKLTLRAQLRNQSFSHPQRLLLKSPVHTARIPLLLQLFPDAQFIYIHRHPYDVFRSAAHMVDTAYWYTYFQTPTDDQILEFILRQYEILWDRYEEGRKMLKENQLVEVSYDEISQHPEETVKRIYKELGWKPASPAFQQRLREELGPVTTFRRNQHAKLNEAARAVVDERWGPSFERLGYRKGAD